MPAQQSALADVFVNSGPREIDDAQAAFYQITLTNRSDQTWSSQEPNPIHVAYHWYDDRGQVAYYDGQRTRLPRAVAPGESVEVSLRVHPPALPGRYILEIDMVHEGVRWFELGERIYVEVRST